MMETLHAVLSNMVATGQIKIWTPSYIWIPYKQQMIFFSSKYFGTYFIWNSNWTDYPIFFLPNSSYPSRVFLLSTWNVPSGTEKLSRYLILINLSSHMWQVATTLTCLIWRDRAHERTSVSVILWGTVFELKFSIAGSECWEALPQCTRSQWASAGRSSVAFWHNKEYNNHKQFIEQLLCAVIHTKSCQ